MVCMWSPSVGERMRRRRFCNHVFCIFHCVTAGVVTFGGLRHCDSSADAAGVCMERHVHRLPWCWHAVVAGVQRRQRARAGIPAFHRRLHWLHQRRSNGAGNANGKLRRRGVHGSLFPGAVYLPRARLDRWRAVLLPHLGAERHRSGRTAAVDAPVHCCGISTAGCTACAQARRFHLPDTDVGVGAPGVHGRHQRHGVLVGNERLGWRRRLGYGVRWYGEPICPHCDRYRAVRRPGSAVPVPRPRTQPRRRVSGVAGNDVC